MPVKKRRSKTLTNSERIVRLEDRIAEVNTHMQKLRDELKPFMNDVTTLKNWKIYVAGIATGVSVLFGIIGTIVTLGIKIKWGG